MTEQEFRKFIEDQHDEGRSDEDIVKIFAKMFQDGKSDRDEFEALIGALGYELSEDLRSLSDDELREKVVKEKDPEGGAKEADTIDPDGDKPEGAEPPEGEHKGDSEPKDEDEGKPESEDEGDEKPEGEEGKDEDTGSSESDEKDDKSSSSDEDEKKKAFGLFGLKD